MSLLSEASITGLALGAVYGVIALGFVLIYKSSGVLNMAQGSLVLVGSFLCYSLGVQLGLPFPLAIVLTLVLSLAFGFLIERVLLRPLVGEEVLPVIMVTFALLIILENSVMAIYGPEHHLYPQYLPVEPIRFAGMTLGWVYILALAAAALLIPSLTIFYKRHRIGIAMRATADDQQVAQSLGIKVEQVYGSAWAISCLTASVGGIVLGTIVGVYFGMSGMGMKVFPALIVGGMDSIVGSIVGGLMVGLLENIAGVYLDPVLAGIKDVSPYIILLLVIIFKPFGLFGLKRIERI
jgi:branched-chain amino acid transport system permease protein